MDTYNIYAVFIDCTDGSILVKYRISSSRPLTCRNAETRDGASGLDDVVVHIRILPVVITMCVSAEMAEYRTTSRNKIIENPSYHTIIYDSANRVSWIV